MEIAKAYIENKNNKQISTQELAQQKFLATVESLMTNVFGKYLIRYYGSEAQKYHVVFSHTDNTSYQDANNHKIVISLTNVIAQIQKGVNALAVAYHELAHILYTNNTQRDNIRANVVQSIVDMIGNVEHNKIDGNVHSIWNVLEDHYIERKLMHEEPFLRNIINPLKTILSDDGSLMSWRLQEYAQKQPPQELVDLCDTYINLRQRIGDNTTSKRSKAMQNISTALLDIYIYLSKEEPPQDEPQEDDDDNGDEPTQTQQGGGGLEIKGKDEDEDEPVEEDKSDEPFKTSKKARSKMSQEEKDQVDKLDQLLKSELEKVEEVMQTQIEQAQIQVAFGEQSAPLADTMFKNFFVKSLPFEIPTLLNLRNTIRNGISQAQAKSYKSDPSFKLNTPRLIESIANKVEPKVFYGKGKDASSLRKVVIFQDVSGSTEQMHSCIFDIIAYSLSKSFEDSKWYLYGDKIIEKHKRDYNVPSIAIGNHNGIAGSTNSWYLTKAMRKHKQDKALFVVITDGDIHSLIRDEVTFNKFRDSTAFVGELDKETQKFAKYFATINDKEKDLIYNTLRQVRSDHFREIRENVVKYQSKGVKGHYADHIAYTQAYYKYLIANANTRKIITRLILEIVQVMKGQLR
jgi:outer membrane biosynthesis protein TonB